MKNLSIKASLVALMSANIVVVAISSAIALQSIHSITASAEKVGNFWIERLLSSREVKSDFADMRLTLARLAMVNDEAEFKAEMQALDADFYVLTGHKVYGPTGIGVLYGKQHLLEAMPPWQGGGEMIETVTTEGVTYNAPPHRFEAGTPPIVQAIGLGAAMRYMESLGREAILAHETDLRDYAMQRLGEMNSIRIYGTTKEKGAIVAFSMNGAHAHDVATVIDRSGVAVRAGTHCAMPLLTRFGVTSTCRASFALYNTRAEVDALVTALRKAEALFG